MDKFYETKHDIFNLSMEDRLKFCQKMVLDMTGRKLSWSEANTNVLTLLILSPFFLLSLN